MLQEAHCTEKQLEQALNNKHCLEEQIRCKKNELENIIQYKTKGAIIRSKADGTTKARKIANIS